MLYPFFRDDYFVCDNIFRDTTVFLSVNAANRIHDNTPSTCTLAVLYYTTLYDR